MDGRELAERDRVCEIAEEWIGTPFHNNACLKGVGCDCAHFLRGIFVEAGLVEPFETGHYSPQHFLHQETEHFLGFVSRFADEIPKENVSHGDIALYKVAKCYCHGALIIKPGWPHIIHAHFVARQVRRAFGTSVHLGMPILDVKFFSKWQR